MIHFPNNQFQSFQLLERSHEGSGSYEVGESNEDLENNLSENFENGPERANEGKYVDINEGPDTDAEADEGAKEDKISDDLQMSEEQSAALLLARRAEEIASAQSGPQTEEEVDALRDAIQRARENN